MNIASIGIDLGKTTFHLIALGEHNKTATQRLPKFGKVTRRTFPEAVIRDQRA